MISSKVFALSLLFVSPLALAEVQLNANMEISNSLQKDIQSISTEATLGINDPATVVYNGNDMEIKAQILTEQENHTQVCYTVSAKNEEGVYEVITAPEFCAVYGDVATITLGHASSDAEQVDSFSMTLQATKA